MHDAVTLTWATKNQQLAGKAGLPRPALTAASGLRHCNVYGSHYSQRHGPQLVSAVSVVISLIYLAAQIRQNTRAVRNSTHHALTITRLDYIALVAQNPDLSHILRVGMQDLLQLNEDERQRFHLIMYYLFSAGENFYYQNRQGQLDTEQWERWCGTLRYYFTQPGIRAWFEKNPIPFTAGFIEFLKREFQMQAEAKASR